MYKNIYKNTCLSVYFLDGERSSWPQHLRRFVEKILQTHQIALVFCRRRIQDCLLYCDTTSIKKSFKVHAYLAIIKSQQQNHHRLNKAQLYSWFGFLQAIAAKSKYDDGNELIWLFSLMQIFTQITICCSDFSPTFLFRPFFLLLCRRVNNNSNIETFITFAPYHGELCHWWLQHLYP